MMSKPGETIEKTSEVPGGGDRDRATAPPYPALTRTIGAAPGRFPKSADRAERL